MDGNSMTKKDQIRAIDVSLMCIFKYAKSGSFAQYCHMQKVAFILAEVREELAKGTEWSGRPFTVEELAQMDRPPATLVAKKILEDLNND